MSEIKWKSFCVPFNFQIEEGNERQAITRLYEVTKLYLQKEGAAGSLNYKLGFTASLIVRQIVFTSQKKVYMSKMTWQSLLCR